MFAKFLRKSINTRNISAFQNISSCQRKNFSSIISIHTTFPATLHRFQPTRNSGLFDYNKPDGDGEVEDGLHLSVDGLIYPRVSTDVPCWWCPPFILCPRTEVYLYLCQSPMARFSCPIHARCKNGFVQTLTTTQKDSKMANPRQKL